MNKIKIRHDLETAYGNIYGKEEENALIEVLRNSAPSCGRKVKQFEDAYTEYCGTAYALAVSSATTGLTLAGIAAGVGPGDEVITTPLSWIATATAFSSLGAILKFCDVDPKTMNLDPGCLEELITPRTKAIVPVHLYGQCCDMDSIMSIAEKHGVIVIEDCAHNPGGVYKGRKSGSLGHIGVFSFHQQKNMCTLGEGGMVTTSDMKIYEKVLSYRSLCCRIYGHSDKYLSIDEKKNPMGKEYWKLDFDDIGYNYRMTDAQAAVGVEQLKKIDEFNNIRRNRAALLTNLLKDAKGINTPWVDPVGEHTFHLYMIQLSKDFHLSKADFMWNLYTEKGIKAWSHYMPIHLTDPYREKGHKEGECPVLEEAVKYHVTLPIHPRLTDEAIIYMAESIKSLC